jgi:hypothetical protein
MNTKQFSGEVAEVRLSHDFSVGETIATIELHDLMSKPHEVHYIAFEGGMLQQAREINPLDIITVTADFVSGKYYGRSIIGMQSVV